MLPTHFLISLISKDFGLVFLFVFRVYLQMQTLTLNRLEPIQNRKKEKSLFAFLFLHFVAFAAIY